MLYSEAHLRLFPNPVYDKAHEVLATAELLEAILSCLDIGNLLRVQVVCRRWKRMICSSPTLQQQLFLRPLSQTVYEDADPEINPLLKALLPPLFRIKAWQTQWRRFPDANALRKQEWYQDERRRETVLRTDASWRRMFPVQPPVKIDAVVWSGEMCCYEGNTEQHGSVSAESQKAGATMGLIWDTIFGFHDLMEYSWVSTFFVDWGCFRRVFEKRGRVIHWATEDVGSEDEVEADQTYTAGYEKRSGITLYSRYIEACYGTRNEESIVVPSGLQIVDYDWMVVDFRWEKVERRGLVNVPLWGRELEVEMEKGEGLIEAEDAPDWVMENKSWKGPEEWNKWEFLRRRVRRGERREKMRTMMGLPLYL
jgi:hypothetical protein